MALEMIKKEAAKLGTRQVLWRGMIIDMNMVSASVNLIDYNIRKNMKRMKRKRKK